MTAPDDGLRAKAFYDPLSGRTAVFLDDALAALAATNRDALMAGGWPEEQPSEESAAVLDGRIDRALAAHSQPEPHALREAVLEWSEAADRASVEPHDEVWDHREFVAVQRMRRLVGEPNRAREYDDEPRWFAATPPTPASAPPLTNASIRVGGNPTRPTVTNAAPSRTNRPPSPASAEEERHG